MTDLSSYTHKWRAAPATAHQSEGNKVNKRNRQPVSCAPCRSRKLKCDRGHPCDACSKRNDEESCVYGKTAVATSTTPARRDDSRSNMKAQERLRHLEELVKQMIGPDTNIPTPRTPPIDDHQQPEGSLNGTSYTGSTHWATVLDQIQELRSTLLPTDALEDQSTTVTSDGLKTDSIFSAAQPPPFHIILQRYLPSREDCNRYLSTYFNSRYIAIPFIHKNQFKRQYESFWNNQQDTSLIWMSIFFSILCMAENIRNAPLALYQTDPHQKHPASPFLVASTQCLVLGNYAKPQPLIVEALAMHCQCKYAVTLDPSHELGLIFSVLARQAYRMGYHREPSLFENRFTTFECEMRRRIWSLLRQFDLMVSFQHGLPAILAPDSSDTRLPTHLLDDDFDEDTTVLPPSRPDTEPTQMLYLITKAQIIETYSKICQHNITFSSQPVNATDITTLDKAIDQTIETIPIGLRARPMSECYADPPNLTMIRSNLMMLGEKARSTLHRKYMVQGPNTEYSRRKCIKSSTRTISQFLDIHAELKPGGLLFNDRWMLTSFVINDFLLGLMVLSLAFSLGRKRFISNGGNAERWLEEDAEAQRLFNLLDRAQPVCAEYGTRAKEARHVAAALKLVLTKLRPDQKSFGQISHGNVYSTDQVFNGMQVGFGAIGTRQQDVDDKMPLDIMPLSIHSGDMLKNETDSMSQFPHNQLSYIIPESGFDLAHSTSDSFTFVNPTEPSPSTSWDMMDGPLLNILEGPEQIDWIQFDQFLYTYGVQNGVEDEIL